MVMCPNFVITFVSFSCCCLQLCVHIWKKVYDSISPTGLAEVPKLLTFYSDCKTVFYISGTHDGANKEYCLLGLDALQRGRHADTSHASASSSSPFFHFINLINISYVIFTQFVLFPLFSHTHFFPLKSSPRTHVTSRPDAFASHWFDLSPGAN